MICVLSENRIVFAPQIWNIFYTRITSDEKHESLITFDNGVYSAPNIVSRTMSTRGRASIPINTFDNQSTHGGIYRERMKLLCSRVEYFENRANWKIKKRQRFQRKNHILISMTFANLQLVNDRVFGRNRLFFLSFFLSFWHFQMKSQSSFIHTKSCRFRSTGFRRSTRLVRRGGLQQPAGIVRSNRTAKTAIFDCVCD